MTTPNGNTESLAISSHAAGRKLMNLRPWYTKCLVVFAALGFTWEGLVAPLALSLPLPLPPTPYTHTHTRPVSLCLSVSFRHEFM